MGNDGILLHATLKKVLVQILSTNDEEVFRWAQTSEFSFNYMMFPSDGKLVTKNLQPTVLNLYKVLSPCQLS
jgi:hypothetical protein